MAAKQVLLTKEGIHQLEAELENLKTIERNKVAEELKEARAQGDLSENAEYDAAKDRQAEIETRIVEIEKMLKNVIVINGEDEKTDAVRPGHTVKLYDATFDEEVIYKIVGSTEADPLNGKLSNESPVGSAIIGKQAGDTVRIDTDFGTEEYTILEITN
ncbi:transcription elongation factor GreA [Candidatus Epulonipiscium fishelsonii]|uniref:Transcription elongation factor GreA n=1 Tax=Candidatus Epulonipiscium fishelsonii TaxID=77094 RepID=A0ACC8XFZ5_9FIRM|nr:transcription elongation factor GreA [Epulopiscium sp. SCG-B11WGA-EpuloA1]ONI42963.1 transcription elongation factor GreA [Epulopiscium sp. SCG-B05WGA-EpuloA1]